MERPSDQPLHHVHGHGHGKKKPMSRIREDDEHKSSWWVWALVILCTLVAIGVIVAGATVFAVYLLYKPKMPYMVVTGAQLGRLVYGQDGVIHDLQVSINILARNTNSRADASFSRVNIAVGFHGADLARLQARPFRVARESETPLPYDVVSKGAGLDPAGMRSMDEALKRHVVPLDLFGKARTRWKMGIFLNLQFWTRISCRLHFNFPGNGTALPIDRDSCRSRSP